MTISLQEINGVPEYVIAIASEPHRCDPRVLSIEDARRLHEWLRKLLDG
jgi:hypothetical protein